MILFPNTWTFPPYLKCFSLETQIFFIRDPSPSLSSETPSLSWGTPPFSLETPSFIRGPGLSLTSETPLFLLETPDFHWSLDGNLWGFQNYSRALILIQIIVCCKQTFAELSNCEKIYPTNGKTAFSNQKYLGLGGGYTVFLKNCKWNPKTKDSKCVTV